WVMRKVDALFFFAPLVEREVHDPAQCVLFGVDETEIGTDLGARFASKLIEFFWTASDEEDRIAVSKTELCSQRCGALFTNILGNRAGACAILEEDIAKAWL